MQFTQPQLEAAFQQMQQERQADANFARLAADALQALLVQRPQKVAVKENYSQFGHGAVTPYTTDHVLAIELSQYDDWQQVIADLTAAGVTMQPWSGLYHKAPQGEFDVSKDTQFQGRSKQKFTVRIDYYDGGY
jgi:hypothetical protein